MRKSSIKRFAIPVILVASSLALMGSAAMAAGPYSFSFTIPGYDGVAFTSRTVTASSTLAPYIEVELTSTSPSNNNNANFTAANANGVMLSGAQWLNVSVGSGYQAIYAGDTAGQSIKLMGGTGILEGQTTVTGNWKS